MGNKKICNLFEVKKRNLFAEIRATLYSVYCMCESSGPKATPQAGFKAWAPGYCHGFFSHFELCTTVYNSCLTSKR